MAVTNKWKIYYPVGTDVVANLRQMLTTNATSVDTALTNMESGLINKYISIVASETARNALYPSPVPGNTVYRSDTGVIEKYTAAYNSTTNPTGPTTAQWLPSDRIPFDTFNLLSNGVPSATVVTITPSTRDTSKSNSPFLTVVGSTVRVPVSGIYAISGLARLNAPTNGRSFIDVNIAGSTAGRFGISTGEDQGSFALPTEFLAAGTTVSVSVYKTTTPAVSNVTGYVRLAKIGNA